MNCNEFQKRLVDALDIHGPGADETPAFLEHLSHCETGQCPPIWEAHRQLTSATSIWRSQVPQVDLRERVIRELREQSVAVSDRNQLPLQVNATYKAVQTPDVSAGTGPPRRSASASHSWGTVASIAAALMLMVSLLTLGIPDDGQLASNDSEPLPAAPIAMNDAPPAPHTVESPVEVPALESPHQRYASMPLMATRMMTDAVVFVVPTDLSESDADDANDEPSQADGWADRIGRQLEPIGRELSSAFEAFMQAVPKTPASST